MEELYSQLAARMYITLTYETLTIKIQITSIILSRPKLNYLSRSNFGNNLTYRV